MAPQTFDRGAFSVKRELVDPNAHSCGQHRSARACRCAGCGSPLVFDSLILSCRCADEAAAPSSRADAGATTPSCAT